MTSIVGHPVWCSQRLKLESSPAISRRGMLQRNVYRISDLYDFNRSILAFCFFFQSVIFLSDMFHLIVTLLAFHHAPSGGDLWQVSSGAVVGQ